MLRSLMCRLFLKLLCISTELDSIAEDKHYRLSLDDAQIKMLDLSNEDTTSECLFLETLN